MSDTSPSVPVESREQPREEERWPEFEFIDSDGAWRPEPRPSVDETARLRGSNVYLRAELQQADATIRELRAEVADHEKRWQQRADLITRTSELRHRAAVLEAEAEAMPARYLEALEAATAERDRARDLAAHLEEDSVRLREQLEAVRAALVGWYAAANQPSAMALADHISSLLASSRETQDTGSGEPGHAQ